MLTLGDAVDAAALQSVVQYMYAYTATLEFSQDTVWHVLEACVYLELEGAGVGGVARDATRGQRRRCRWRARRTG